MSKRQIVPNQVTSEALAVLGQQIRLGRHDKRWTVADLAERVGVTPKTMTSIENGSTGSAIGNVFYAATLVGVPLFGTTDPVELAQRRRTGEQVLALLPSRVDRPTEDLSALDF